MFSLSLKTEKIKDIEADEDERLHSLAKIFSTKEDEWLIRKYICNMLVSSINYEHKKQFIHLETFVQVYQLCNYF